MRGVENEKDIEHGNNIHIYGIYHIHFFTTRKSI